MYCLIIPVYRNCAAAYKSGNKISGVYKIDPTGLGEFEVFCDQETAGGGWAVFQKRMNGSVDFYRGWDDYLIDSKLTSTNLFFQFNREIIFLVIKTGSGRGS